MYLKILGRDYLRDETLNRHKGKYLPSFSFIADRMVAERTKQMAEHFGRRARSPNDSDGSVSGLMSIMLLQSSLSLTDEEDV